MGLVILHLRLLMGDTLGKLYVLMKAVRRGSECLSWRNFSYGAADDDSRISRDQSQFLPVACERLIVFQGD